MGFENEFASYEPLRRILSSKKVKDLQNRLFIREKNFTNEEVSELLRKLVYKEDLSLSDFEPDYIIAIDGSYHAFPVENGFPGAEEGYITLASVLVDIAKIKTLEKKDIIDPKKFRETEKASTLETVIPGCNVVLRGESSPKTSMRRVLFEEMGQNKVFSDSETLLDTYQALLKIKIDSEDKITNVRKPRSPLEGLNEDMQYGMGEYLCSQTSQPLFSTDALRLHELLNEGGTCGEMYGQIMSMMEKLWLVHILRAFEKRGWIEILQRVAFILDGPLACFSTWSWMNKSIIAEIRRINELQKKVSGGKDLIIIGIEKSGTFCEHFKSLDIHPDGSLGLFPEGATLLLDDTYIKKNIIFSDSPKVYGEDIYFGRKFFYKTTNGYMIVPVLCTYTNDQQDLKTADKAQFPRLGDVLRLLDRMVSSRYQNSLSPLVSAHAEAAIPLNLSRRIFEDIARELRERKVTS